MNLKAESRKAVKWIDMILEYSKHYFDAMFSVDTGHCVNPHPQTVPTGGYTQHSNSRSYSCSR